jgi:hypothetical protein
MLKVDIVLLHQFNLANQLKLHIGQVIILTVGISSQVYQEIFISMKPLSVLTIINKRKNYMHHYLLVDILCFQLVGKASRNNHL